MSDQISDAEAVAQLKAAIEVWWAAQFPEIGPSILTSWYLVAAATSYDEDGDALTTVGQQYSASVIEQAGLIEYARRRVYQRMGLSAEQDDDS